MRRFRGVVGSIAIIALFGLTGPVSAQHVAFGVRSDNDLFNFWLPTDRRTDYEYTAGNVLWMEWSGEAAANSRYAGSCGRAQPSCAYRIRIEFAQRMFTPRSESDALVIPGERPHAGYISVRLQSATERGLWQPSLWLEVGAVGPIAFASEAQQFVHKLLGFREPRGWDRQLPNEPVLNVGGSIHGRFFVEPTNDARLAIEPFATFDAGTGIVGGAAGSTLAFTIGSVSQPTDEGGAYGARVEAGSEFRLVLRDVLLDGTLFAESRSVHSRRAVPHAFAALTLTLQRFDLSYGTHWRGRSYETEPGGHTFSSLQIAYRTR